MYLHVWCNTADIWTSGSSFCQIGTSDQRTRPSADLLPWTRSSLPQPTTEMMISASSCKGFIHFDTLNVYHTPLVRVWTRTHLLIIHGKKNKTKQLSFVKNCLERGKKKPCNYITASNEPSGEHSWHGNVESTSLPRRHHTFTCQEFNWD